jgi:hypothetical protein
MHTEGEQGLVFFGLAVILLIAMQCLAGALGPIGIRRRERPSFFWFVVCVEGIAGVLAIVSGLI